MAKKEVLKENKLEAFLSSKPATFISLGALLIVLIILWLPTRTIPYWWDSAGFVVIGARNLLHNNFSPLDPNIPGAYAHPFLFTALIALLWKVFGESLLLSHLVNLFFAVLGIIYLFFLGRLLFSNPLQKLLAGITPVLLLLFTPLFYAQLGIIYFEIPVMSLSIMTVYYFLRKNIVLMIISSAIMVLLKETSILVVGVLGFYTFLFELLLPFLKTKKLKYKQIFQSLFPFVIPIVCIFVWLIYHKIITGWFFIPPHSATTIGKSFDSGLIIQNILAISNIFFLSQYRFLLVFLIVVFLEEILVKEKLRANAWSRNLLIFGLIPLSAVLLFGFTEFIHRYIIFSIPFFYLTATYCLLYLLKNSSFYKLFFVTGITLLIILFSFKSSWDEHREITSWYFVPLEENLEYLNIINLSEKVTRYIEVKYPNAVVYTAFPTNYMLSQPFQHFTKKPIKTIDCAQYKQGQTVDVIIFHLLSPGEVACKQLIDTLQFSLEQVFEENGKQIGIFVPQYKTLYIDEDQLKKK